MESKGEQLVYLAGPISQVALETLAPLVGLRLLSICRAVTLGMFGFGLASEANHGEELYDLHTESPWRIDGPEGVVTGKSDIREPSTALASAPGFDAEERDYDQETLMDERAALLLPSGDQATAQTPPTLLVREAKVDSSGSFDLLLSEGYRLLVFVPGTQGEHWRLMSQAEGADRWSWVLEGSQFYMIRAAEEEEEEEKTEPT